MEQGPRRASAGAFAFRTAYHSALSRSHPGGSDEAVQHARHPGGRLVSRRDVRRSPTRRTPRHPPMRRSRPSSPATGAARTTSRGTSIGIPVEALSFWGLAPGMTVLEVQPGGGWWTEILAPYAQRTGGQLLCHGRRPRRTPRCPRPRASRAPSSSSATRPSRTCTARSSSSTGARNPHRCRPTPSTSS